MTTSTVTPKQPFSALLKTLVNDPTAFTAALAKEAAAAIMGGEATPAQIGAFLVSLKFQGKEHDPAIIAAVAAGMRAAALQIPLPEKGDLGELVDIVGTGGDGQDTFNVSTAAGIVAAGAGCKVAKHGNRASSSACGSADVLESLSCALTSITAESVPRILEQSNFCFLFSQTFHPAMKNVAAPRREIGVRTIFNLLGPLSNPALPSRVVVGVHSKHLGKLMAQALHLGGVTKAWVVHGAMGLDEISPEGETHVWEVDESGSITELVITPKDFGLKEHPLSSVVGGNPTQNAKTMTDLLGGSLSGPILDFVLLNAGALLYVSGKASTLPDAVNLARMSITEGKAKEALEKFAAESQRLRRDAEAK
ncbi:anthranilate phosphoribosyltransferase [Borealophlyctis nickersoniae]|nr:anthranilate phosphoribosyltransferase [Borealophlyctis nickersoniae]